MGIINKMEFEESIYNLIPKEQYVAPKPKRHRSQYPADLEPTASTFGLNTTSKPVCSNLSGKFNKEFQEKTHYQMPLDTVGKKNRMDGLTKEMDQVESDIKKL